MPITLKGKTIQPRGANKKYPELDDLDWLYGQLRVYSIAEFCDLNGYKVNSRNSVRYRVEKYFPEEWKASIKRERKRHTNVRGAKRLNGGS